VRALWGGDFVARNHRTRSPACARRGAAN